MKAEKVSMEEVRKKFVGRWIALKDGRVLTVSDSHDELMREVKQKGLDGIYVFYSPTEKEKKYEFLF